MKYYYLFIFVYINFTVLAQNVSNHVFYLDESLKKIDSSSFHIKSRSVLYESNFFKIGDTIIRKLSKEYDFGKLNQDQYNQIVDTLKKINNKKNPSKDIILIYNNYLLGYADYPESLKTKHYSKYYSNDKKDYIRERKKYDKKQKKCLKKFSSEVFHLYTHQNNFNHKPKYFKHYKAADIIKETFFRFENHGVIILKPNGNYFFYKSLTEKQLVKMLNSKWDKFIEDLNKTKINPNLTAVNFITQMRHEAAEERDLLAERRYNFNNQAGLFSCDRYASRLPYSNREYKGNSYLNLSECYTISSY